MKTLRPLVTLLLAACAAGPGDPAVSQSNLAGAPQPAQASPAPAPLGAGEFYDLDLRHAYYECARGCGDATYQGRAPAQLREDLDLVLLASGVQGLVNRTGPRLYLETSGASTFWLGQATGNADVVAPYAKFFQGSVPPWSWAAGLAAVPLGAKGASDLDQAKALLQAFAPEIKGWVVWSESLPELLDVATTVAGVEDYAIVRKGSALEAVVEQALAGKPRLDLTAFLHTKMGAVEWAMQKYLGKTQAGLIGYMLGGDPWLQIDQGEAISEPPALSTRDYLVANRGFVVDLSPWSDHVPPDDRAAGVDGERKLLEQILAHAQANTAADGVPTIWGFYSTKYNYEYPDHLWTPGGVPPGEFASTELFSSYDARITGGGGQMYGQDLADTTFHEWGAFPAHAPRNATPTPDQLTDLGWVNQHLLDPGFEWGGLGPWSVNTTNRVVYRNPAQAAGGNDYLEVNVDKAGENLFQDVVTNVSAGDVWRVRVQYRFHGQGHARLALWGMGGSGQGAVATLADADGNWHQAEATLTAGGSHTRLRVQIFVDTPGVNLDLDEFRLARLAPFDDTVAPLTFVSFELGDYVMGCSMYDVPAVTWPIPWNDPARDSVPGNWAFNPDATGYLPGVMAFYYYTRGPLGFLTASSSGGGYIDPSYMTPTGQRRYVKFARRWEGKVGESFESFFTNGYAHTPDSSTMQLWNGVGPDGVMVGLDPGGGFAPSDPAGTDPDHQLFENVPWGEIDPNWPSSGRTLAANVAGVQAAYENRYGSAGAGWGPRFLFGRSIYTGPSTDEQAIDAVRDAHPTWTSSSPTRTPLAT